MSKRSDLNLVQDIIECGSKILDYTAGLSFEDFLNNNMAVDAVVRNFEIIGEAANRLSEEFKDEHPQIDWFRIRGFRNRLVHDYFNVDYSIVWEIKEHFLREMLSKMKSINA